MMAKKEHLRLPTNRTKQGPRYVGDEQRVVVEYDCEQDDGSIEWATVRFDDVLEYRVRQGSCCAAGDLLASGEILCLHESALLSETLARWQTYVGWQEWQRKQGGAARFRHFKIYFDDVGGLDVVAARYTLVAP